MKGMPIGCENQSNNRVWSEILARDYTELYDAIVACGYEMLLIVQYLHIRQAVHRGGLASIR
jgi:hypothetical protein